MIKHSKTLALLAPGLLLAGCNMAPHYVRPDLPVAPSVSSGIGQGRIHRPRLRTPRRWPGRTISPMRACAR
jgi:hypothetical protein